MATAVSLPTVKLKSSIETVVELPLSRPDSPSEDLEIAVPRTIDELIRLRARQHGQEEPVISYPDQGTEYIDYTPKDLDELVERAAVHYSSIVPQRITSEDPVQVVGILGESDLSYAVTFLAVSRLGHSALLLSTRITDEAHESLLNGTKATALLCHEKFAQVAATVAARVPALQKGLICQPSTLPAGVSLQTASLDPLKEAEHISFIIHSSGSTGLPKPIFQTHRASL